MTERVLQFESFEGFTESIRKTPLRGPVAVILAEDDVELTSTLNHMSKCGFGAIVLLAPADIPAIPDAPQQVVRVAFDTGQEHAHVIAVNALIPNLPVGTWVYYGYNAEYLFYPFCETRTVGEMLAFHEGERRDAMLAYVVDLYADDLDHVANAVSLDAAYLDRSGYFALGRKDPKTGEYADRQLDFFGGLRWRFEEHVPSERRRIDRIALFRTEPGLELYADHTFNASEYNTYACPWHHNLTASVCSFRTAKALRTNPGSRYDIQTFMWRNSVRFDWHSQQLLDLGLMEPGQWF